MDFQYNFRQANQDRLEDAGVKQYRPLESARTRKTEANRAPVSPLRVVFATILGIFIK